MFQFIQESIQQYFQSGVKINPILILIIVGSIIQFTKVLIDLIKSKKFVFSNIFAAGGFPSFHAGIVTSIVTMTFMEFGFDHIIFALAFSFAILFLYDAMNVRFESGQQAKYINEIRLNLKSVLMKQEKSSPLKERIGHTPIEVFGGMLFGIVITFVLYYYFILA
ncbi:MAG TPA: divergent PAP2 family protein [Candidatus Absconditabacterales bacterium]|nr:divergent PAP2 family protein [Candidatus Absconditabacterales bacterium]